MARALVTVLLAATLLLSQGCASLVSGGSTRPVPVDSDPQGAEVYVNDDFRGKTPLTLNLARRERHRVRVVHPDREPYDREVKPGFNPWFLGNIAFGGLIGAGIDLLSGAVLTPKPGRIRVFLLPPGGDYADKAQVKAAEQAANPDDDEDRSLPY